MGDALTAPTRALLLVILLGAAFLRFWDFATIPPGLHYDEAFNGMDALDVLATGPKIFFEGNTGREPLFNHVLAVGVADAMHVLVDYQNRCRTGDSKAVALKAVYHELFGPLFLTGLTTAIGMLSLAVSRIESIRTFGIFAAYGVGCAFLLTVTFVPVVLSYLPAPEPAPDRSRRHYLSTRALEGLHAFTVRRGTWVVVAWTTLVALALLPVIGIKLRKSPFDISTSHHAHQETVRGVLTEFSGRQLALVELTHWYEAVLLLALVGLFWATNPLVGSLLGSAFFFARRLRSSTKTAKPIAL